MRISNPKMVASAIAVPVPDAEASIAGRRKELAALIQAALKVGADLSTRDAGRRAFSEFMKLVPVAPSAEVTASGQAVIFAEAKRKKTGVAIL